MVCLNPKFGISYFSVYAWSMIFCQKQVENRLLILMHYLKGLSLSFQKITLLDHRN